jgi:hypothetical protein
MAFLDFIRNRNRQQSVAQTSQERKPETAKAMYTRQAMEEKANRVAPTQDQEARARKIGEEFRKATQHSEQPVRPPSNGPNDDTNRAAQRDKQNRQDKTQEALSPTDGTAGKTASQEKPAPPDMTPPRNPPTLPRPRPSWER